MRALVLLLLLLAAPASAEPLSEFRSFARSADFFATGTTLAADQDGDSKVDTLLDEATVTVSPSDLAPDATVQLALLYWAGSVPDMDDCSPSAPSTLDTSVDLRTPQSAASTPVTAESCSCDGGGAQGYDIQSCRADVTALVQASGTALAGSWTVGGFDALIENGSTHNASFAVVLVYSAPGLRQRRLTLYDGLQRMSSETSSFSLSGLDVDDPPSGDLTWYVLEGDLGGSSQERVTVAGSPGGGPLVLGDAVNPFDNPMNRTINTTSPPQEGVIGVDIDTFDISPALAAGDDALQVQWTAGLDKWWAVFGVVGVNVFYAAFADGSTLRWTLIDDADGDGLVSGGDTLRYRAELVNGGDGNATVDVELPLPPEAARGAVTDAGGGIDTSSSFVLSVLGVPVPAGTTAQLDFDVEVAEVPDGSELLVQADYSAQPDGGEGRLEADPATIHRDGDGDGLYDRDDPCPQDPSDGCFGDDDDAALVDDDDGVLPGQRGCACDAASGTGLLALLLLLPRRRFRGQGRQQAPRRR